ncbi:hypothetical protein B0T21DRAFT_374238 [Apiosordaria backusii]|uniref:Uncharacterized protein n=1 Tax=Apiosordaria backusii TaxID=314023 RepID=A0AA40AN15_9PEZI|nr:hypothetical protein B0T21DRAFT_374238 [Apiosordaria backusii]
MKNSFCSNGRSDLPRVHRQFLFFLIVLSSARQQPEITSSLCFSSFPLHLFNFPVVTVSASALCHKVGLVAQSSGESNYFLRASSLHLTGVLCYILNECLLS